MARIASRSYRPICLPHLVCGGRPIYATTRPLFAKYTLSPRP